MNNEFEINGTENDLAWVALTANDPASSAAIPKLDAIKVSLLSEALKVTPISKRSWLAPVAVAASVALFIGGGAGYTLASSADNSISIPLGGAEMSGVGGASDSKMSSPMQWGGRPYLEAGPEISNIAGKQVGYTFDASDVDRKAQLEIIANVFEIDGKISGSAKDGYFVGDSNYLKAVASTSGSSWDLSQLVSWNFSDSSVNPQYCGGDAAVMNDTKSSVSGGDQSVSNSATGTPTTEPAPGLTGEPTPDVVPEPMPSATVIEPQPEPIPSQSECELPLGVFPSDESAMDLAKAKFSTLGFNVSSANWTVSNYGQIWGYDLQAEAAFKLVTAKVLVDGIETNQSWTLTVGPDGVLLGANGFYAKFVATSEYEIVGAKTAVERSQDGLWMNFAPQEVPNDSMFYPMPLVTDQGVQTEVRRNSNGQPLLDGGLDRVTITKAEKSLLTWYLNDGTLILLPAYLLSADSSTESRQWLQLAIGDQYLDFS